MDNRLADVRCFLLDMDGTVNLGDRLLPGAREFFDLLPQQNRDFLFLTNNSSRHGEYYAARLSRLGLPVPEGPVSVRAMMAADEVFLASTTAEASGPVTPQRASSTRWRPREKGSDWPSWYRTRTWGSGIRRVW